MDSKFIPGKKSELNTSDVSEDSHFSSYQTGYCTLQKSNIVTVEYGVTPVYALSQNKLNQNTECKAYATANNHVLDTRKDIPMLASASCRKATPMSRFCWLQYDRVHIGHLNEV